MIWIISWVLLTNCLRVSEFKSYLLFLLLILLGIFQQEESEVGLLGGGNGQLWTLGLGLLATALAAAYVTRLAKVTFLIAIPQTLSNHIFVQNLDLANME